LTAGSIGSGPPPATWIEREAFPVDDPVDPADPAALLDYQAAAAQALVRLRDTRRGGVGHYVTHHWVLSFYGEYALAPLLGACAAALTGCGLVPVPPDRVHLPLLRIGAADDLTAAQLERIEWAVREWAGEQHQFRLRVGPPTLGPGGVRLCAGPWEELLELRHGLRRATREVLGLRPWLRELIPFRPHVPIAYATAELGAAPLRARLAEVAAHRPVALRIRRLSLLRISRSAGDTSWFTTADVTLGRRTTF
jgi:2'-5' RNA ligase